MQTQELVREVLWTLENSRNNKNPRGNYLKILLKEWWLYVQKHHLWSFANMVNYQKKKPYSTSKWQVSCSINSAKVLTSTLAQHVGSLQSLRPSWAWTLRASFTIHSGFRICYMVGHSENSTFHFKVNHVEWNKYIHRTTNIKKTGAYSF